MGRVRRYGYTQWFLGDHVPRHVHVYDRRGVFIGRLDVDRLTGGEGWTPDPKLVRFVRELRREGRL